MPDEGLRRAPSAQLSLGRALSAGDTPHPQAPLLAEPPLAEAVAVPSGSPAVLEHLPVRPLTLRTTLSRGLPFSEGGASFRARTLPNAPRAFR